MAISTATSILFFIAMIIADECSAAFPTIATMMTPINSSDHPNCSPTASNVWTRLSDTNATAKVANTKMVNDFFFVHSGSSCSVSTPSSLWAYTPRWVTNLKNSPAKYKTIIITEIPTLNCSVFVSFIDIEKISGITNATMTAKTSNPELCCAS